MRLHPAWTDLVLALAVLAGAALLLIGAAELPPPRFEPMGSAALPRILAGFLICFAVIIAAKAAFGLWHERAFSSTSDTGDSDSDNARRSLDHAARSGLHRGLGVFASLLLYILALDVLQWPFIPVTIAFVMTIGTLLSPQRRQAAWQFLLYGTLLSGAVYLVMTRFLFVDLG